MTMIDFIKSNNPFSPSIPLANYQGYSEEEIEQLKNKLSLSYHINSHQVFIDNGSSAIIEKLIMLSGKILLQKNEFYLFEKLAQQYYKETIVFDNSFYFEELLSSYHGKNSMALFSLVNNRDGKEINISDIVFAAQKRPDILFVVDGAYREYSSISVEDIQLLFQLPNIVYLGTFSKAYGLASYRIGYMLNHPNLINLPFSINRQSAYMASYILEDSQNETGFLNTVLLWMKKEQQSFLTLGCIKQNHKLIYHCDNSRYLVNYLKNTNMKVLKLNDTSISISLNSTQNNQLLQRKIHEYQSLI